jgi:hypothetical protein
MGSVSKRARVYSGTARARGGSRRGRHGQAGDGEPGDPAWGIAPPGPPPGGRSPYS